MPPRRTYLAPSVPTSSSSLPYLGPPPTDAPPPPSSSLAIPSVTQSQSTRLSPLSANLISSSSISQPLNREYIPNSQPGVLNPPIRRANSAGSTFSLPPIPSLAKPLLQTSTSQNRALPSLSQETPRTWPPLYGPPPLRISSQFDAMPRMPGMDVVEVSDSEGIQTPLRKRRREESAARRQRRKRAEYRLREAAVAEATRSVERERTAQLTTASAGSGIVHTSTGTGAELRTGVGTTTGQGISSTLGFRQVAATPNTTVPRAGVQANAPAISASLNSAAGSSALGEGSTQIMRELRELRETVLTLHNIGMSAEAHRLVQVTLQRLSRRD